MIQIIILNLYKLNSIRLNSKAKENGVYNNRTNINYTIYYDDDENSNWVLYNFNNIVYRINVSNIWVSYSNVDIIINIINMFKNLYLKMKKNKLLF